MYSAKFILDNAETQKEKVKDLLISLYKKGETVPIILDFIKELRIRQIAIKNIYNDQIFDVCGTGGSGKQRINLSTILAIKLSKKFKIAKHGNSAASGKVGSFDLISELSYESCDTIEKVQKNLQEQNLAFVFAPAFLPCLKSLAIIRKEIKHATVFNFLGPMLNPLENLTAQMTGVSDPRMAEKLAECSQYLKKNILFVHDSVSGLDDVSILGTTLYWKVYNGKIKTDKYHPKTFGLEPVSDFSEIQGGETVAENKKIFQSLINENASVAHSSFLKINYLVAEDFFSLFISKTD